MDEILSAFGDTVLGILRTVAPGLATAVAGPLGGVAVSTIINALGLPEGSKPSEVAQAITSATPETLLKLKQAENDFKVSMRKLQIETDKLQTSEWADARRMAVETKDWFPKILAMVILALFAGEQIATFFGMMPTDETAKTVIVKGVSLLESATMIVLGFYFGNIVAQRQTVASK